MNREVDWQGKWYALFIKKTIPSYNTLPFKFSSWSTPNTNFSHLKIYPTHQLSHLENANRQRMRNSVITSLTLCKNASYSTAMYKLQHCSHFIVIFLLKIIIYYGNHAIVFHLAWIQRAFNKSWKCPNSINVKLSQQKRLSLN